MNSLRPNQATSKNLSLTLHSRSAGDQAWRICPSARTTTCYTIDRAESRVIANACGKYSCEVCGPKRKWKLVLRIRAAEPTRFLTLTCNRKATSTEQLTRMTAALPRLVTALRKTHGEIEYIRMLEQCKDGYPHFHLLLRAGYLPYLEIRSIWERLTGATIVDIRKAHGRSLTYIAKYINKARDSDNTWSRQRVSVSKNFWRDQQSSSDMLGFTHHVQHPIQWAQTLDPDYTLRRLVPGIYAIDDREPGDDLPPELKSDGGEIVHSSTQKRPS